MHAAKYIFCSNGIKDQNLRFGLTGVQTLCNCRGIYEVACAEVADNVFVQVLDLQLNFLLSNQKGKKQASCQLEVNS